MTTDSLKKLKMKIEVKDYHDVYATEEYWRGMFHMADTDSTKKYLNEMTKWNKLRKHLEELAGVKEEE